MLHDKANRLERGETFITSEKGNSMTPRIMSGQKHKLAPVSFQECEVGDIVYCWLRGRYLTHLVTAINPERGLRISNNHGKVNGWTKQVYGKVIEIL